MHISFPLSTMLICLLAAGAARAQQEVLVTADIATSTTWTASNTYNLQRQIYVLPGATLTIEAGTVIASTTNLGGSLAVCKGAQIFVRGTALRPVIMTSKADVATWTGGNPKTGAWREAANEWGNLTVMGAGYVSANRGTTNSPTPSPSNVAPMEGLVAAFPNDPKVLYGGGNDDDDSGTIRYLSLRYGGKVIGLNNELNGLSLGGIGRETDVDHVEIMNNVDDGIEIWGGTVNIRHFSIWNVGDDSFDVDQGWRGKAQFGLIVQGHSLNASQGSGVGDNMFEVDGAEDSSWQPVTTAAIYNCTLIGQPLDGDRATAWRDNARVQYRNCVFTDCGEEIVGFDNVDGDGSNGYGFQGTLGWAQTWTTSYAQTSTVNAPPNPGAYYRAQSSGMLAEITDSVFFSNLAANAYTEANNRGVFAAANNNVQIAGNSTQNPGSSPIGLITRGAPITRGGKLIAPVTVLDPRPKNEAFGSAAWAPRDGFFSQARYRGAFQPGNHWLAGWTAAEAFGFVSRNAFCDLGYATGGTYGDPMLSGLGTLGGGQPTTLTLLNGNGNSQAALVISLGRADLPVLGGTLVPDLSGLVVPLPTSQFGGITLNFNWPLGVPPATTFYMQCWIFDPAGPANFSVSNALAATTP